MGPINKTNELTKNPIQLNPTAHQTKCFDRPLLLATTSVRMIGSNQKKKAKTQNVKEASVSSTMGASLRLHGLAACHKQTRHTTAGRHCAAVRR